MKQLTTALGDLCHLLFLHAFTGCDTTSKPFGVWKAAALEKTREQFRVPSPCSHLPPR